MPAMERTTIIGRGLYADVFAWGEGRVLKLFRDPDARPRAEREFAATQAAYLTGLPTPAAYETIEVNGRAGIVFERIPGESLLHYTQRRPWKLFAAIRLLAELHADIHKHAAPTRLPLLRDRLKVRIEACDAPAREKQVARSRPMELPDGNALCHGDFHPDNVLLTPRGPVVIDWSSASRGHPAGDVAWTTRLMQVAKLPPWSPWHAHLMLRYLRPALYHSYLNRYFRRHPGSRRDVERWQVTLAIAIPVAFGFRTPDIVRDTRAPQNSTYSMRDSPGRHPSHPPESA